MFAFSLSKTLKILCFKDKPGDIRQRKHTLISCDFTQWFNLALIKWLNHRTKQLIVSSGSCICIQNKHHSLVWPRISGCKAAQPVRLLCIVSIFLWVYKSPDFLFSSDLTPVPWECSQRSIFGSLCDSHNGLLHCLQWLQQATTNLRALLLRWEAGKGLYRLSRFCIWGKTENCEEGPSGCHLLWGSGPHHWFYWTNWSGSRDRPADVEGNGLHRGKHNCHGDTMGGFVDELLQTSQHQDAVQGVWFPTVSAPGPPGCQGSDVQLSGSDLLRPHRCSSGHEVYQSGGPSGSHQAYCSRGWGLSVPVGLSYYPDPCVLDRPCHHQGFLQPPADWCPTSGTGGGSLHRLGDLSFAFHCWSDPAVPSCSPNPGPRWEDYIQPWGKYLPTCIPTWIPTIHLPASLYLPACLLCTPTRICGIHTKSVLEREFRDNFGLFKKKKKKKNRSQDLAHSNEVYQLTNDQTQ